VQQEQTNWFSHWFDTSFYHSLYANRNEKEAAGFVDELVHELAPAAKSVMLDLGCGNGRHARQLAAKGFDVTGIDLAGSSIQEAKRYERENLRFRRLDMRRPFGVSRFDYVFNFFTSFGYFKTAGENLAVIRNIHDALKPGGYLLMDYMNSSYSERRLIREEEKEIDGIRYYLTRWTSTTHFFKKIVIDTGSKTPFEYTEQVEKLDLDNFHALFEQNSLKIEQVFGDYSLNEYDTESSPRLIMLVKKVSLA
jgi:SAM-dependent methyltransferase